VVHATTHTHPFNGPLSGTTQVSRYQKGKTNLDFTEARDIGWQWHQLGYMQVCTSLQTDNHTSTPPLLCFLRAGCPSCRPTNSVKALKAHAHGACYYWTGKFCCLHALADGNQRIRIREKTLDSVIYTVSKAQCSSTHCLIEVTLSHEAACRPGAPFTKYLTIYHTIILNLS